jgi:stage III sporulation protein AG
MSEKKSKNLNNIVDFLKKNKTFTYVISAILAMLLCVFVFGDYSNNNSNLSSDTNIEYIENLEKRLSDTLSCVKNAGKVKVVITVGSGMESVLATKVIMNNNNGIVEKKEEPITVNGKTVVLKENYPKITGVLIVAEGASNISVKNKLLNATISLLDVEAKNIEILTMK